MPKLCILYVSSSLCEPPRYCDALRALQEGSLRPACWQELTQTKSLEKGSGGSVLCLWELLLLNRDLGPSLNCSAAVLVTISMPRHIPYWSRPRPTDLISWPDLRTFSSLEVAQWPGQGHQIFPTCLAQAQWDWTLGEATASSSSCVTLPSFWLPLREQPAFAAPSQISSEPFSIQIFTSAEIALGVWETNTSKQLSLFWLLFLTTLFRWCVSILFFMIEAGFYLVIMKSFFSPILATFQEIGGL